MRFIAVACALILFATGCSKRESEDQAITTAGPTVSPEVSPTEPPPSASPARTATATARPPRPTVRTTPSDLAGARVKLSRVATLNQPIAMAVRAGDDNLYVAEKGGRVRILRSGKVTGTALDISSQVSTGSEQGLLGIAFPSSGDKLYVNFTNTAGDTRVREYAFSGGRAAASSARDVLRVDQPESNHNGGNLAFGPDGYLYIGLGDGGGGGDQHGAIGNGQNLDTLLGKMLRIDPRASGSDSYRIPPGNPFVGRSGRDEIWSYGTRNPWRYSFDRSTGDLYIADVGQNAWEEVNFRPRSSTGGENYGWRRTEGLHAFDGGAPANWTKPIYEYSHASGGCSITGGYVYRGKKIAKLAGAYLFADFCAGRLRAFVQVRGGAQNHRFLGPQVDNLSSFGQDHAGELYVMSLDGGFYRIDPA